MRPVRGLWWRPTAYNESRACIERLKAPSWKHWFGTDNLGRDVLSRCIYGAQPVGHHRRAPRAALATLISIGGGHSSAVISAARLDLLVQRFVDAWMSFPDLIILIVVVSVVGPGHAADRSVTLGLLLGIGGSRIVRSAVVIGVRENMYVHAAQSLGASSWRILWRHILPNVMPPIIVLFTTRVGTVILAESACRSWAWACRRRRPTWGGMLSGSGRTYMNPGPVAGAGAGPVPDADRGLRDQRVRRRAARPARPAHARARVETTSLQEVPHNPAQGDKSMNAVQATCASPTLLLGRHCSPPARH